MSPRPYRLVQRAATAQATRQRILDAALQLFGTSGYHEVTLREIAVRAEVSLNAIYSSVGAKPQLLVALITNAIEESTRTWISIQVESARSGREALRALAGGLRQVLERNSWLLAQFYDNASAEPAIAEARAVGDADYINRLRLCVVRLSELGVLREELTEDRATDIIWFFLAFPPWRRLRESGWSWDEAEEWLFSQTFVALVDPARDSAK